MNKAASQNLRRAVLDYLETHNTMTLAAAEGDTPWAAALFYANDGLTLYFLSATSSRHSEFLVKNPKVAITVNEDYHDWKKIKGIQMEGRAELVKSEAEKARAVEVYVKKYPFVHTYLRLMMSPFPKVMTLLEKIAKKLPLVPAVAAGPTEFYRVKPVRVWFIDNERGLGHRQELPLESISTSQPE